MQMNDLILISVDDHIIEPPDLFTSNVAAKYRDHAPRVARFSNGEERWMLEGKPVLSVAAAAVSGRVREELGMEPMGFEQIRKGCYDVHARVDDMNANGVLASLNFANLPGFAGEKFILGKDKDLMLALVQAYNDWHVEQWAGAYPGRFIPMGFLPLWDASLAVKEIVRLDAKGVKVVGLVERPTGFGLPSYNDDYWDPIFRTLSERELAVVIHIGTSGAEPRTPSLDASPLVSTALLNLNLADPVTELVFCKYLRKYPNLRFAMSEGCMGWVPFLRERCDAAYKNHRFWTGDDFGDLLPSDLIDSRFLWCFHEDDFGLRQRHDIGIDNIAYEVDYPHADSTWPHSPERLWDSVKDFPVEDIEKMTYLNGARCFKYDPFRHIPKAQATVGALRAQAGHVDVTLKSMGGWSPKKSDRPMTVRDKQKLMQEIDRELGEVVAYL